MHVSVFTFLLRNSFDNSTSKKFETAQQLIFPVHFFVNFASLPLLFKNKAKPPIRLSKVKRRKKHNFTSVPVHRK